jgi:hypothetical protein
LEIQACAWDRIADQREAAIKNNEQPMAP